MEKHRWAYGVKLKLASPDPDIVRLGWRILAPRLKDMD